MDSEAQTLTKGVVNPTYVCKSGSLALFRDLNTGLWASYFDTVRDEPGPLVRHVLTKEREWRGDGMPRDRTDYYVMKLSDGTLMRLVVQHMTSTYMCMPYAI